jgi:hypothetical protein
MSLAGDDMSMPEHTMMSDSSQRDAEMYGGIQRGIVPCREETHSRGACRCHSFAATPSYERSPSPFQQLPGDERWRLVDQQLEELLPVVLDGWDSVMTTGEHRSWIPMDELLVESLGLTKACDTFQSYSQLQMFLLAHPDTFIIDNNIRPWQGMESE